MEQITIHKGESCERVFVDAPDLDVRFVQEEGSRLKLHLFSFRSANHHIVVEQVGTGCETEIYSLAFPAGEDKVCVHTNVRHMVGGGRSNQLLKFALPDHSVGDFYGELYIAQDAQQTEALQNNRNILLSDDAVMRTRPQLEIYADDVKASHGASTGQLDESALFYMQQRCIDAEKARKLLIGAFLKEITTTVTDEGQREELVNTIDSILEH